MDFSRFCEFFREELQNVKDLHQMKDSQRQLKDSHVRLLQMLRDSRRATRELSKLFESEFEIV